MNIAVKVGRPRRREAQAAAEAYATPLADLNPARADRFQDDTIWPVFEAPAPRRAGALHRRTASSAPTGP